LPEPIQNEPHPIFKAIEEGNFKEFKEIIEKDRRVLEEKDSKNRTPIFYAIRWGKLKIVEEIISQAKSVLEEKDSMGDTPISYAIIWGRSEIAKAILNNINEDLSVLKQEDSAGNTPILKAIKFKNLEIVEAIIKKYPPVLGEKNSKGRTPIYHALSKSVLSSGRDNEDEASKVLQTILDHQFQRHIDKAGQEDVKELFLRKMLINGIYSGEDATFNLKCLEKAFDKITPESTFKKIYQDLFKNVDKNQPISSKKNEEMYIFQSKLRGHSSFFIFHVNKVNELTSISYCDGNTIDEGRRIENSTTHINGVTTFKLNAPIEFSSEFAKNFIKENTENKKKEEFYKKFIENTIKGAEIDYSKTTHSIPTKKQKRGNCAFKSPSLAARKISQQQNPKTMDYGFDPKTQEPTGNGHYEYKEFKAQLARNALVSIIKTKKTISSKLDPLSEHFKKEIEDTIKIAGDYNKRKSIPIPEEKSNEFRSAKRRKLVTKGIHNEIAALLKSNESPNESLSPRTNKTSPLSTKITDPQITRP